jgi:hypothetical protein
MSSQGSGKPMTSSDASRIQATEAKQSGGGVEKGGFAARAQSAAAGHEAAAQQGQQPTGGAKGSAKK